MYVYIHIIYAQCKRHSLLLKRNQQQWRYRAKESTNTIITTIPLLPFYGHCTGQPALASTPSYEWEDSVTAKFLLPTCPL